MKMFAAHPFIIGGCLLLTLLQPATAQDQDPNYLREEMPKLPAPDWVRMVELGNSNANLKGMRAPAGIKVEIVASEPTIVDPVGMTFANDGSLYVLEWRAATEQIDTTYDVHYQDGSTATVNRKTKNVADQLKHVTDSDGDGVFDHAATIMNDLEMPSSILLHNEWMYFPSVGHVIRRKANDSNNGFDEEEILRGMCGYHHHQVSGLTIGHDNWLYTTTGDDDNVAEGSDGSRATVLRTGAIFRSRPDGSQLTEFARGFRNPYRNVVFDENYNMFHVDNDQEDGSKFQGVRLMHLLEGADYGWRLEMGAKCCRTDFERGAVFGERPGKMPSMLKTGRGAPAGLLIYQGTKFPDFFRGLLIYPDVYRMNVRAYEIQRRGSTFEVVKQFVLMEADDGMFRPVQAIAGPDGAIYVLDWRTNSGGAGRSWGDGKHGRIYRLSWEGIAGSPSIPLDSMDSWKNLNKKTTEQLFETLTTTTDFELRERAQNELLTQGEQHRARFLQVVRNTRQAVPARASALGAASHYYNDDVHACLIGLLQKDASFELRRLAADGIARHINAARATDSLAQTVLTSARGDQHPAVRRSAALAAGQVAALANTALQTEIADALWQLLKTAEAADSFLYDGILRGLERCGPAGVERLVTAVHGSDESDRDLATRLFPALRIAAAAEGLDKILTQSTDQLSAIQIERLLAAYRHILVRPAVEAKGAEAWLEAHPGASANLQMTALETLGLVGGGKSSVVARQTLNLLESDDPAIRSAAIDAAGNLRVMQAYESLYAAFWDQQRTVAERQAVVKSLARLRAEDWPFADRTDKGVELVLPDLIERFDDIREPALVADAIWLIGQIDFDAAQPIAQRLLASKESTSVAAAIDVLGSNPQQARQIGKRLLANQLAATTRPQVTAILQRHLDTATTGEIAEILSQLYRDGLTISLEPSDLANTKKLVTDTGNAERGRDVFLNAEKSQCLKCHRIEGVGGLVGPDLNKIWQTHTIEKIIESIVDPSREIKEGFESWTVTTTEGKVYGGLKISDGPPRFIVRDTNGRDYRIPLNEIDEKQASKKSLMPEQIVSQMTLTEFVDLVAFLKDEKAQRELPNYIEEKK